MNSLFHDGEKFKKLALRFLLEMGRSSGYRTTAFAASEAHYPPLPRLFFLFRGSPSPSSSSANTVLAITRNVEAQNKLMNMDIKIYQLFCRSERSFISFVPNKLWPVLSSFP